LLITPRRIVGSGYALLLIHVVVLFSLGTASVGPFLSDLLQLMLGFLLVVCCFRAARICEGMARHFWQLASLAFSLWLVAQGIAAYSDVFRISDFSQWSENLLFSFWFVPLAMALFLDPDRERKSFDWLLVLDFIQAVLFCIAAYLYFFYIPRSESPTELAHSVWSPYFAGYGLVAVAFILRARSSHSSVVRSLFGRMGIFLLVSGVVDALYYYGPGSGLKTGAWFDALWSALLVMALWICASFRADDDPALASAPAPRHSLIATQLFPLLYPLLILAMSAGIAHQRINLAAAVVLISFACSSARLLVTHHRLLDAQEALRREATHDGLSGLWNRRAILDILERELLRAQREDFSVGIIMADVDHFKTVNDSRGHAAGDVVLRIVASEIAAAVRPYDSVGRYGGEEFLIIAPGCNMEETWHLAERVRSAVANCSIVLSGQNVPVSLSVGMTSGKNTDGLDALLRAADLAMYQAKSAGRNRVEPRMESAGKRWATTLPEQAGNFWL
jgi:diguanylate cyclase (GGDEF)-like protein